MARDDLPKGYGGWQAIDSTPQELSDRKYVLIINTKVLKHLYDICSLYTCLHNVGKKVSTNKPKCKRDYEYDFEENITQDYKYKEGHVAERSSVITANMTGSTRPEKVEYKECDVFFELVEMDSVKYGEDFIIKLSATNKSEEIRTLGGGLSVHTMYYTGVTYRLVQTDHFDDLQLSPGENDFVNDTKVDTDIAFIKTKAPLESVTVGEPCKINVSFTNPLPVKLTKCILRLEGSGIQRPRSISQKNVDPGTDFKTCVVVNSKPNRQKGNYNVF
ncbi:hypothetical protein KUTeg_019823 [Tegillarca granosa]|uniref:Uncharacterized protein n=1 Tax=Tegillarca granosa TaxID=220873 RepID=A0ABQ9EDP4_TEGGR|nr:hypothetical protein KUTeg_019823 [Tegillarca granosa]